MLLQKEREEVVEYSLKASQSGLCPGTSGNLSAFHKFAGMMAITPSGIDYDKMCPEDVVVMDLEGHILDGYRKPSSEWGMHSVFYKNRPDVCGVVHTHSMYCTTFAILQKPIRMIHYEIANVNNSEVPVAPYRLFGTPELAEEAYRTCGKGNAVLLSNHGIVVCGKDLAGAFALASSLENAAELQYHAEAIGRPNVLTDEQMDAVRVRFGSYGQGDGRSSY